MKVFDTILTETVRVVGTGGDEIPTYTARPLGDGPYPGMVMLHHAPGWDEASKEIVRKLAVHGYIAAMPNLHVRDAPPGATPEEAGAASRAAGNVPDLRMLGDVEGAVNFLRTVGTSSGRMGCLGFCYGGREALVASGHFPFDATIVCYGGSILLDPHSSTGQRRAPDPERRPFRAIDLAPKLKGPLLGLFGVEDPNIPPSDVEGIASALKNYGVAHFIYNYEGAGHAFMGVDQKSFRWMAAKDAWNKIWDFGDRYLCGGETPDPSASTYEVIPDRTAEEAH